MTRKTACLYPGPEAPPVGSLWVESWHQARGVPTWKHKVSPAISLRGSHCLARQRIWASSMCPLLLAQQLEGEKTQPDCSLLAPRLVGAQAWSTPPALAKRLQQG